MKIRTLAALLSALLLLAPIVANAGSIYDYSTTAASNTDIDGTGIEGTDNVSNFDDAMRASLANLKAFALDLAGKNTVGGTADAITITPTGGNPAAAEDGMFVAFVAGSDNATTSPTANVGSLGAQPIKKTVDGVETALAAGDIQSGGLYALRWRSSYDSSGGAWELIDWGYRQTLVDIEALAVTDGNIIVGDGSNWVAESGATARTSLGLGTSDSPQFSTIELGNASDTTLSRSGAGVLAVEGVDAVTTSATQTLTNKTFTSAVLDTGVSGTAVLDEDDMSSDSATQISTQQSIKAYIDTLLSERYVDIYRLTANKTSAADITSGWERPDDAIAGTFGTAVTESSGEFSFSKTGLWEVQLVSRVVADGASVVIDIVGTSDDFSTEDVLADSSADAQTEEDRHSITCSAIIDVTNVTTHKIKIAISVMSGANSLVSGNTDKNVTYVKFRRLGDT